MSRTFSESLPLVSSRANLLSHPPPSLYPSPSFLYPAPFSRLIFHFLFPVYSMDEPPKRLRAAAEKYGITESQFGVSGLGETTRVKVEGR